MWAKRDNTITRNNERRTPRQIAIAAAIGVLLMGSLALPMARGYSYVSGVWVNPNPVTQGGSITITALANATDGYVSAAEFHIDEPAPTPGTGFPMAAQDGAFDEAGEAVVGVHSTGNLSVGNHTVCVLARETSSTNGTSWNSCGPGNEKVFVVLSAPPAPPVANAGSNHLGWPGVPVQFDGSGSYDPDGNIVAYSWTFGDGDSGTGVTPSHVYLAAGYYQVYLTVTDDSGLTDTDLTSANITGPSPPVAIAGGPYSGLTITFNGSASYDYDGFITEYFWDFGDGNTAFGAVVTHTYAPPPANTTYVACLRVTDNDNMTDTDCVDVGSGGGGPSNQPPVADAGPDQTGLVGEVLTFDGSASYDPDGFLVEHFWSFSDGATANGAIVTHAFMTPSPWGTGNLTYHTACLRVTDNNGSEDWDCADITVIDPSPAPPRMLPATLSGSDVRVRWQLSADDGAGFNDVVSYEVLVGSTHSTAGAGYAALASVLSGTAEYLHVGVGAGNAASFFYIVRAVDANGQKTPAADQAGKFARSLTTGEQLVSAPLELEDWSVGSVFQTIAWTRARTYVNPAGQGKNWLSNDKQKPWADLTTLSRTMAVWVKLSADGIWAVAGLVPASTQVVLRVGWNFIGYPGFTPQTVAQFLAGVSYQTVEGYAANPPHNLQRLTGSSLMSAGNGYWVHVSVGAVVILGN